MKLGRCILMISIGLATSALMAGCATQTTRHHATNIVQYLYPKKQNIVEKASIPVLSLPLRVGIAFVPMEGYQQLLSLSEKDKQDLMKQIGAEFKQYPFVKSIEIIPSPYLMPMGSFTNLDQIRTMYGIDVIALLSFDQVQHTDKGLLSLSYWTLVGAYVIKRGKK